MPWRFVEKEFLDYAEDIEAVSIHYVCAPPDCTPDWENQRVTRYMPLVKRLSPADPANIDPRTSLSPPNIPRLRKKVLKLPVQISSPQNGETTGRYHLHYYFEIWQDGHRHYSPLYTEEVTTDVHEDVAPLPDPHPESSSWSPAFSAREEGNPSGGQKRYSVVAV